MCIYIYTYVIYVYMCVHIYIYIYIHTYITYTPYYTAFADRVHDPPLQSPAAVRNTHSRPARAGYFIIYHNTIIYYNIL